MGPGIRAEVRIDAPETCPIADVSAQADANSLTVSKSVNPGSPSQVIEEFMLDGPAAEPADSVDQVFSYGENRVYRFTRDLGRGCPCELVEQHDCPVLDVHTRGSDLHLVFHAPDMEVLHEVIAALQSDCRGVDVTRLLRSSDEDDDKSLVFVDRSDLTARQEEVLRTAHKMGYFEHPKDANAGEVAAALGITTSTFTEHLAAAQRKLLSSILEA